MTRLPPATEDNLDDDQRIVWDSIVESRGAAAVGPDGGLIGPFNAMVVSPRVGLHQARLGAELRFNSTIERRLSELAICVVSTHWRSEFEFWAHSRLAVGHGISPNVIEALADGRTPEFARRDEATVYAVTATLLERGRIDDDLYRDGVDLVGHQGMVELTALIGYYCMISLGLNVFDVGLPDGEQPTWTG